MKATENERASAVVSAVAAAYLALRIGRSEPEDVAVAAFGLLALYAQMQNTEPGPTLELIRQAFAETPVRTGGDMPAACRSLMRRIEASEAAARKGFV